MIEAPILDRNPRHVAILCPFCGAGHVHGSGSVAGGAKASHCVDVAPSERGAYVLTDRAPTVEEIERAEAKRAEAKRLRRQRRRR